MPQVERQPVVVLVNVGSPSLPPFQALGTQLGCWACPCHTRQQPAEGAEPGVQFCPGKGVGGVWKELPTHPWPERRGGWLPLGGGRWPNSTEGCHFRGSPTQDLSNLHSRELPRAEEKQCLQTCVTIEKPQTHPKSDVNDQVMFEVTALILQTNWSHLIIFGRSQDDCGEKNMFLEKSIVI